MDLSVKMSVETVKITDAMRTRASVRWAARVAGMETIVIGNVPHVVHFRPVTDIEDVRIVMDTVDQTVIHALVIRMVETVA